MSEEAHFLRKELFCPDCGGNILEVVSDGLQTNFLCQGCWTCWHWDLGWMVHVSPATCRSCSHRSECLGKQAHRNIA